MAKPDGTRQPYVSVYLEGFSNVLLRPGVSQLFGHHDHELIKLDHAVT